VIQVLYAAISEAVNAHLGATSHRSSSLIEGLPSALTQGGPWLAFSPSQADRRSLFEQVLWTFFFDRSATWETTWPEPGRPDAEYVAVAGSRSVAPVTEPAPRGVAKESRTASRGIAPTAPAAPAQLAVGDVVEITDGAFSGFRGRVVALSTDGRRKVDLELWVDGVQKTVEGFRISQVQKVEDH
jgi:hypothetical protein